MTGTILSTGDGAVNEANKNSYPFIDSENAYFMPSVYQTSFWVGNETGKDSISCEKKNK